MKDWRADLGFEVVKHEPEGQMAVYLVREDGADDREATITERVLWDALQEKSASGEPADLIAGALYDLMGYLTTRDETIRLGATELATPAVDALVAFAAKRGLSLDNPAIADWSKRIAAPAQPAPARVPLTDAEVDDLARTMVKGNKSVNWLCRAIEAAHGITAPDVQKVALDKTPETLTHSDLLQLRT